MKKAEDWYRKNANTVLSVPNVIRLAQLEAIEETVKLCAENASLKREDVGFPSAYGDYEWVLDKDSILNCAEILKKEIE